MAASPRPLPTSLPDPSCLRLDDVVCQGGTIVLVVSATGADSACPRCGVRSHHVHSRYCRTLRDLPCHGAMLRICLRMRRFYCRVRDCPRRIFTQQLPTVALPYGRQTFRYREALLAIGYASGGEAGHRLAMQLGIDSSTDTILRVISRSASPESAEDVKVLGVDDWAWRRGHRYGTVLVDLERRQPIDPLPDRESGTLAKWLQVHPTVRIISRDRAGAYADGARQGAPDAVRVADRFHLFCNLAHALQRLLERLGSVLRRIELPEPASAPSEARDTLQRDDAEGPPKVVPEAPLTQKEQTRRQSREKRKELFETVRAAFERGVKKRAIALQFGINSLTVRRYLRAQSSRSVHHGDDILNWTPFGNTWRTGGQMAVTMRPNSVASYGNKATADSEAG
jgi:transposase